MLAKYCAHLEILDIIKFAQLLQKSAVTADMFTMLPKTTSHSKVVFNANSRWDLQALASSTERPMKFIFYGTTKAKSSPSRIINQLQEVLL